MPSDRNMETPTLVELLGKLRTATLWTVLSTFLGLLGTSFMLGFKLCDYLNRFGPTPGPRIAGSTPEHSGRFEWQWAGENQMGKIVTSNDGEARVDMFYVYKRDGDFHNESLYNSEHGTISFKESQASLKMTIVDEREQKTLPDEDELKRCHALLLEDARTLRSRGKLIQLEANQLRYVVAFAGKATYHYQDQDGNRSTEEGDMVLVDYRSGLI